MTELEQYEELAKKARYFTKNITDNRGLPMPRGLVLEVFDLLIAFVGLIFRYKEVKTENIRLKAENEEMKRLLENERRLQQ